MLNKVILIGHLIRDPEIKTTTNSNSVATFSLATNKFYKDQSGQKQEQVEFHNIVAWNRLAEICSEYLNKGSKVYIEGRIETRSWQGEDEVKRYKTEIVAENLIMLSSRQSEPEENEQSGHIEENPTEENITVENIPF